MKSYKNLLVVIDPASDHQAALGRAVFLSKQTQAHIHVLLPIYDFSYEMTTMLSVQEREAMREAVINARREWLDQILNLHQAPESVTVHVIWHNRPFEAVIRYALAHQIDLIIKTTRAHDSLKSVIFTPTDWHLIRKAPVPVLLVKAHEWPEQGKIIAAVDAGNDDPAHQGLNNRIIEEAKKVAGFVGASVELINSYPGTPINIAIEIPDFDPESYTQAVKKYHITETLKLAKSHQIDEQHCHVDEGLPEDVIPAKARIMDAELVVMGTVGRTGFSAALIGNTAEHVIDQLNCDVLAIKPADFECPIRLEE